MNPPAACERMREALVRCDATLRDAMSHMTNEAALVVDDDGHLAGLLTDGDLRRSILAGASLDTAVHEVMTTSPVTISPGLGRHEIRGIMIANGIRHLPVIDSNNIPIDLELIKDQMLELQPAKAVVMAGGEGTRMRPMTLTQPKPLLKIGDQTILDTVLTSLQTSGINDVLITVNYLAEQIKDHVGTGADHHLCVQYVEEEQALGTAGALALIQPRLTNHFVVMNGDLVTNLDFRALCSFHQEAGNDLTVCVRPQSIAVPYGVVSLNNDQQSIAAVVEKPPHEFLANAGIYVLEPEIIELVPEAVRFDMPDLITRALNAGLKVGAFPILEYWRDVGVPDEMHQAKLDLANQPMSLCS